MTAKLRRAARRVWPALLALGLLLSQPGPPSAHAQEEPAPGGEASKGDPVPGYLGAGLLAMIVLFIVGKSARR